VHESEKEMLGRNERKENGQPVQTARCYACRAGSESGIYKEQQAETFTSKEPTDPVRNVEQVFSPLDEQ
jgi:hypothetical protein